MKIAEMILTFCLLVCLVGCCTGEKVEEKINSDIQNILMLLADTNIYYIENSRWPQTLEELKDFCSENPEKCEPVDWDKFASTSFQTLPDGRLKIEAVQSSEQGEFKFNAVFDPPKKE